jgi:hypothetical protein
MNRVMKLGALLAATTCFACSKDAAFENHAPVLAPDEAQKLWTLVDAQGRYPRREASQHFILSP